MGTACTGSAVHIGERHHRLIIAAVSVTSPSSMRTYPSSSPHRGPAQPGFGVAGRTGAVQISASSATSARGDDGRGYYP